MPETPVKPGQWCHIEIPVRDTARARKFYGDVFGWTFKDMPGMDYTLYETGKGGLAGGIFQATPEWTGMINYVLVSSIDPTLEKLQGSGGKTIKPRTEIPDVGWFALVEDPEGNRFGLFEAKPR